MYLALLYLLSIIASVSVASPTPALKYAWDPPRNAPEKLARDAHLEELGLESGLSKRTEFPSNPPSCKLCERDYLNIQSCANASVAFSQPMVVRPRFCTTSWFSPSSQLGASWKLPTGELRGTNRCSQMIYNPTRFIEVIQCACTDTFQSAYPQCVDCFTQTNQTAFLAPQDGKSLPFTLILVNRFGSCWSGSL